MTKFKRLSRRYQVIRKVKTNRLKVLRGHPFVVPIITFLGLFFVTTVGLVLLNGQTVAPSDSRTVILSIDGVERTVPSRATTVKDLIAKLAIPVAKNDIVTPAPSTQILVDNFKVSIKKARPVTIVDNGHRVTILSAEQQPRLVVAQAGIALQAEDVVESAQPVDATREAVIGQKVVVDRAKAASINLYGNSFSVYTRAKTVGDLLDQRKIQVIPGDTVQPTRNTKITAGMQVFLVRVGKKVVTTEEVIPAPEEIVTDPSIAMGTTVVREAGADGKKLVTYELELKNDQEVSRKVLQEVIAAKPIKRVIAKGVKVTLTGGKAEWLAAAGINPSDYYAVDYIMNRESHWNPAAVNAGGCIGLGQRCPSGGGNALISACPNWQNDPACQLRHFSAYASRYGGWQGAYNAWQVQGWW
jgi:uncharacterized protein YabE (DUF348 family)